FLVPLLATSTAFAQSGSSNDWLAFISELVVKSQKAVELPVVVAPEPVAANVAAPNFLNDQKPIEAVPNSESEAFPATTTTTAPTAAPEPAPVEPSPAPLPPPVIAEPVAPSPPSVPEPRPQPPAVPEPVIEPVIEVPVIEAPSAPEPPSPPPAPAPAAGTIATLIGEGEFNQALSTCGIYPKHSTLYSAFVRGFTAPLSGRKELALLIGNTAHESASFQHTEEIQCKGVTQVTSNCAYGWYHGRGYIQLSWEDNYRKAAEALGNPAILTNPDIVMYDEAVNWSTVQWYWTSTTQPVLKDNGYTLGNSVKSINGYLECGKNPIAEQRVKFIKCLTKTLTGEDNDAPYC
ncbi:lysozyme-like domain-containing protein, partial [Obelidium mucronatum]